MAKNLTTRAEDYSKWYNELVIKADLAENSGVRGCMVIKPYGYAIWERMQAELDRMFKETLISHFLFRNHTSVRKPAMWMVLQRNVPLLLTID